MSREMALLLIFGNPWLLIVCLALAAILLEVERWWTHRRRQQGHPVGAPAYALDGLVIASLVVAATSALAVLVRGMIAVMLFAIEVMSWLGGQLRGSAWLLAALTSGLALLAAGIAFTRRRQRLRRQPLASAGEDLQRDDQAAVPEETAALPSAARAIPSDGIEAPALEAVAAHTQAPVEPATSPAFVPMFVAPAPHTQAPFESAPPQPAASAPKPIAQLATPLEELPSLSMVGQRRIPAPPAQLPRSFLPELVPLDQRRSRLPRVLVGLMLIVVVGGAVFFRQQVLEFLPGLSPETSYATSQATRGVPVASPPVASSPITTAVPEVARQVRSDVLNLRAGPGTDQQVIATLRHGARVILLNETQTIAGRLWVKVRAGDQEGWVSQEFLE